MHAPLITTDALGAEPRSFATGVTVISAQTADGHVHCMTVNSFASLSLDPPLILWTLRTGSARYDTFSKKEVARFYVFRELGI